MTDRCIPDCTVSTPNDCAELIRLSSRHWYTPSSCGTMSVITSEDPEIWKRCDGVMGSALNSQVMFGAGFPLAMQVKRVEEPGETSWLVRPSMTDAGSVEERMKESFHCQCLCCRKSFTRDKHKKHYFLSFSYREHSQYSWHWSQSLSQSQRRRCNFLHHSSSP